MAFFWVGPTGLTSYRAPSELRVDAASGVGRVEPIHDPPMRESHGVASYERAQHPPPERRPVVRAAQIMTTPVVTLSPETPVAQARALFQGRRFRHVPIVDERAGLVGILSDRDVLRGAPNQERRDEPAPANAVDTVAGLMSTRMLTAAADTSIRDVARVMVDERLGALPILDERGSLVGILTTTDVLRCIMTNPPLELWI